MKPKIIILTLLVLMALAMIPVQADDITVTMANPGGISQRDIVVYFPNGSMQGFYNSTSVITLNTTDSLGYTFSLKPMQTNPLEDPGTWLTNDFIPLVTSNAAALILMIFLAMLWLGRK